MVSDQRQLSDSATVIAFRPRPRGKVRSAPVISPRVGPGNISSLSHSKPNWPGLEADDHRHRMTVNVLGLTFCIVLAAAGVWLVNEIVDERRFQDCVLSGRTDCLPLKTLVHHG
jgi:hypothetical protein